MKCGPRSDHPGSLFPWQRDGAKPAVWHDDDDLTPPQQH